MAREKSYEIEYMEIFSNFADLATVGQITLHLLRFLRNFENVLAFDHFSGIS